MRIRIFKGRWMTRFGNDNLADSESAALGAVRRRKGRKDK